MPNAATETLMLAIAQLLPPQRNPAWGASAQDMAVDLDMEDATERERLSKTIRKMVDSGLVASVHLTNEKPAIQYYLYRSVYDHFVAHGTLPGVKAHA